MLKKHKVWLSVGVVSVVVGAAADRLLYAPQSASGTAEPGGEGGEGGEGMQGGDAGEIQAPVTHSEGGEGGESAIGISANQPVDGASFDETLKLVFGGEGGQGGMGMGPMTNRDGTWEFSVPALDGEQLKKALSENSLRSENHFALTFAPDGDYSGWSISWSKGLPAQCPTPKGPTHGVFDGECWVGTHSKLSGAWSVEGELLCLRPAPKAITGSEECVRAALMLDKILFFGSSGRLLGKGSTLVSGTSIARSLKS